MSCHAPTHGATPVGKEFRNVLGDIHKSPTKAFTEVVENAISADAKHLDFELTTAGCLGAATEGNTPVLVCTTDTYIPALSSTIFQFAHNSKDGHGVHNHLGIGGKAFQFALGEDTQLMALTTDGNKKIAAGRTGSVVDRILIQHGCEPNHIGRIVTEGELLHDKAKMHWNGDDFAQHALCVFH